MLHGPGHDRILIQGLTKISPMPSLVIASGQTQQDFLTFVLEITAREVKKTTFTMNMLNDKVTSYHMLNLMRPINTHRKPGALIPTSVTTTAYLNKSLQ